MPLKQVRVLRGRGQEKEVAGVFTDQVRKRAAGQGVSEAAQACDPSAIQLALR